MMRKNSSCRTLCLRAVILGLLLAVFMTCGAFAQESGYVFAYRSGSYAAYDQQHGEMGLPAGEILISGTSGTVEDSVQSQITTLDGKEALVLTDAKGSITWTFQVEEAGRYAGT